MSRRAVPITLVGALACLPLLLPAQLRVSAVGGGVSATFHQEIEGRATDGVERRTGFALGFGVRRPLHGRISLAAEGLYLTKGGGDPGSTASLRFGYLAIPVLARLDLGQGAGPRPWVAAGPMAAVMLSCTLSDGDLFTESCDEAYGPDAGYRTFDFGVAASTGLQYRDVALVARYEHGLANIDEAAGFTARNRALLLLVTIDL